MYFPKSENELRVIRALLEYPAREWTLNDLSGESGVPKTTVWRIVNRLDGRGIVEKSTLGKTSVIRVKNREVLGKIAEAAFSEVAEMRKIAGEYVDELREIAGVKGCILFGSVARGSADLKSDIDVLILVDDVGKVEDEINLITERVNSERSVRIMPDVMEERKFRNMEKHGADFASRIKGEGVVLHGSDKR